MLKKVNQWLAAAKTWFKSRFTKKRKPCTEVSTRVVYRSVSPETREKLDLLLEDVKREVSNKLKP